MDHVETTLAYAVSINTTWSRTGEKSPMPARLTLALAKDAQLDHRWREERGATLPGWKEACEVRDLLARGGRVNGTTRRRVDRFWAEYARLQAQGRADLQEFTRRNLCRDTTGETGYRLPEYRKPQGYYISTRA